MTQDLLEKNISELFGFSEMSDAERDELLNDIGSLIFESALLRYGMESGEEDMRAFESFIDAHQDDPEMLLTLIDAYPRFKDVLTEEVRAFKSEAEKIVGA